MFCFKINAYYVCSYPLCDGMDVYRVSFWEVKEINNRETFHLYMVHTSKMSELMIKQTGQRFLVLAQEQGLPHVSCGHGSNVKSGDLMPIT